MLKKILIILLVLIVLGALAGGALWYFNQQENGGQSTGGFDISNFFPFGQSPEPTPVVTNNQPSNPIISDSPAIPVIPPQMWKVSNEPQAGAIAFLASSTPMVRYVDKATGNIFESTLQVLGTKRLTNTTIPKVQEAVWQPDSKSAVFRLLDEDGETIKSAFGRISASTTVSDGNENLREVIASFLPDNITSLAVEQGTGSLAYVLEDSSGAQIFVTGANASSPKPIFSSSIKDLSVTWLNKNTIGLSTKPSGLSQGQFYFLKSDSGKVERAIGGLNGLMAFSNNDGTKIVYSSSAGDSIQSTIRDVKTGSETVLRFGVIPDKCIFATKSPTVYCAVPKSLPRALYPDDWYQGLVSFDDVIWKIDANTGTAEIVIDPKVTAGEEVDAINLVLDPEEKYLLITNKKDSILWATRLR